MQLKRINEDCPWAVCAVVEAGTCALEQQIAELAADPGTAGYALGFLALLDVIPATGPRQLGTKLYHYVDEANEIYEFTKGPYRLLCFQAEGRLVVCSHLFRKKSRKAPREEVAKAIVMRRRYLAAVAANEIEFIDG